MVILRKDGEMNSNQMARYHSLITRAGALIEGGQLYKGVRLVLNLPVDEFNALNESDKPEHLEFMKMFDKAYKTLKKKYFKSKPMETSVEKPEPEVYPNVRNFIVYKHLERGGPKVTYSCTITSDNRLLVGVSLC